MIILQEDAYGGVEASCLAILKDIIPDPPTWMANKELAFVNVVRQRANGDYVAHISPVTVHLAGKLWNAAPRFDDFSQWLPISNFPKKPHMCRLLRQQQMLWDHSLAPCLKEEEAPSTTEGIGNQADVELNICSRKSKSVVRYTSRDRLSIADVSIERNIL